MACAEAVHAVQVAELGPCAPKRIDTWPEARLMMADGMKKGEIRRGPPSSSALCSRSMVVNPPIPDAMNTPTRGAISGVTFSPESSIANCDAAMANWMKTSIFLTSFFSMNRSGSKSFTSAANARRECGRVEPRDRSDAAPPRQERRPSWLRCRCPPRTPARCRSRRLACSICLHHAPRREPRQTPRAAAAAPATSCSSRAPRCTRRLPSRA